MTDVEVGRVRVELDAMEKMLVQLRRLDPAERLRAMEWVSARLQAEGLDREDHE